MQSKITQRFGTSCLRRNEVRRIVWVRRHFKVKKAHIDSTRPLGSG